VTKRVRREPRLPKDTTPCFARFVFLILVFLNVDCASNQNLTERGIFGNLVDKEELDMTVSCHEK
jgi:hypothetical protein